MKFPLLTNAFGHQKLILEIGGNAIGVSDSRFQPQQHRRGRADLADDAQDRPAKPSAFRAARENRSGLAGAC